METMTSVGKKFANFARGRNVKKKPDGMRDDDIDQAFRKTSLGNFSSGLMTGTSESCTMKSSKSNSLGSINSDGVDGGLDHDDIMSLTHHVRNFSEGLSKLKGVFTSNQGMSSDEQRASAHEKLGEVLFVLKSILQKYPALHNTDILTSAAVLITRVKSCTYDESGEDGQDILYYVDQLALAFSSSVSEYLMGDNESFSNLAKTKSEENLLSSEIDYSHSGEHDDGLTDEEIDRRLLRLESGVDVALERAKAWSKYAKEIMNYVDKRTSFEHEMAKNMSKLAHAVRQSITEDSFLPFQSIYCTALDQDIELSSTIQATCALIHNQKFIEPLSSRRSEHEKTRKSTKDVWNKELRRMHDAAVNVRKSKSMYITRHQELDKARETAQKTETESLSQSSTSLAAKVEKKKKLVEDALRKAMEAEATYKGAVAEANYRQLELEKVKGDVLSDLRELVYKSDQILKTVTVSYYQLLHTASAPLPLQFQALWETSQHYEAGSHYVEYVKRLPVAPEGTHIYEPFVFEPYNPDSKLLEPRKPSTQSSGSGSDTVGIHDYSPMPPHRMGKTGDDDDSDSDSDIEDHPSPYPTRKTTHIVTSSSMCELASGSQPSKFAVTFRGANLSQAAQTHQLRKLRSPSKCRQCDVYVYFQGAECERCGLASHKKCLEVLQSECGHRPADRRMTTFGVDFTAHVQEMHTDIPFLVRACTEEINRRGLNIKGIYRVSGVKSRVEKLCQSFELSRDELDLSEHHPNVIANVLKLYLRQLPEPLLTFSLYSSLIKLAKDEQQGSSADILDRLKVLVTKLPSANYRTCGLLMHHLKRVTEHQNINQMSASNLGIVFGPTLLRPSEGVATFDSLLDTPHQTRIVELLILNVESVFGEVEIFLDVVDEGNESSVTVSTEQGAAEEGTSPRSPADSRWFDMPEKTENLLDELVKDPVVSHLMKSEEFLVLPGSTGNTSLSSVSDSHDTDTMTVSTQGLSNDDDDDSDDDLADSLLPDASMLALPTSSSSFHTVTSSVPHREASDIPLIVIRPSSSAEAPPPSCEAPPSSCEASPSSCEAPSQSRLRASDNTSSESTTHENPGSKSPGLRKKLLPSQVMSRPPSKSQTSTPTGGGNSIFYAKLPSNSDVLLDVDSLLSKPTPYNPRPSPILKRNRYRLTKSSSFDSIPSKTVINPSSDEVMSNSTFYVDYADFKSTCNSEHVMDSKGQEQKDLKWKDGVKTQHRDDSLSGFGDSRSPKDDSLLAFGDMRAPKYV